MHLLLGVTKAQSKLKKGVKYTLCSKLEVAGKSTASATTQMLHHRIKESI